MKAIAFKRNLVIALTILLVGALGVSSNGSTTVDLDSGLVAYWSFDNQSDPGHDDSENGNDGTVYGATWISNGISGGALEFDGVDDYVDCGNDPSLDLTGNLTITAWVNFYVVAPGPYQPDVFVSKDEAGGQYYKWVFGYAQNYDVVSNATYFHINGPPPYPYNGDWMISSTWTPALTQWYHVAVVKQNNQYTFYLDGAFYGEDGTSFDVPSVNAPVRIGTGTGDEGLGDYWFFNGTLDEVRIYDRALSEDEIRYLYVNPGGDGVRGTIAGTVVSAEKGSPIKGANVHLIPQEWYSGKTDGQGNYVISNVPVGTYAMMAWADGYLASQAQDVEVLEGQTTPQNFELTPVLAPKLKLLRWSLEDVDDRVSPGDHADLTLLFFNRGGSAEDVEIALTGEQGGQQRANILFYNPAEEQWENSLLLHTGEIQPFSWVNISADAYVERVDCDDFPSGSDLPRGPKFEISSQYTYPNSRLCKVRLRRVKFDQFTLPDEFYEISPEVTMVEEDCIRHPGNLSIRRYAQFAVGNPAASDPSFDPDIIREVLWRVTSQVNGDFDYDDSWWRRFFLIRGKDIDLLKDRGGNLGVCIEYTDLSTGLLRSVGLQTRDVYGSFSNGMYHAWNEVLVNDNEQGNQDSWMHFDATHGDRDRKWRYADPGIQDWGDPVFVYADIVPLSNLGRQIWQHDAAIEGVIDCNPRLNEDCFLCTFNTLDWGYTRYECAENVTNEYKYPPPSRLVPPSIASIADDTTMTLTMDAPISVEKDAGFELVAIIQNGGDSCKHAIRVGVALKPWAADSLDTYSTDSAEVWIDSLPAGSIDTLTWAVTALRAGHGIPLGIYSYDSLQTFYVDAYVPQNINEPGTLPDLVLIASVFPSLIEPGETVDLRATVFNDTLQEVSDATVNAHITSETNPGFQDTVALLYSETDSAYVGELSIPSSAPVGDYRSKFIADKTGFDSDSLITYFSVSTILSVEAVTDSSVYDCRDTVRLSATIQDRGDTVGEASVNIEVHTPLGARMFSMESDSEDIYHLSFVPVDFVPYLGDTTLAGGVWNIIVSTDYYDDYAEDSIDITVNVPDLSITSSDISFYPSAPFEGDNVLIFAKIRNLGTAESDTTVLNFFLDQMDTLGQIGADYLIPALAVGDSVTKWFMWNTTGSEGEHTIYAQIDPKQLSVDCSRLNNIASSTITIVSFIRGDANGDGVIDIGDVVYLVNYLFIDGPAPDPLEAGDANSDGKVDIADVVYLVNYLFIGGPPPGC